MILFALPNPAGVDVGNEKIAVANLTADPVALSGWTLTNDDGGEFELSGDLHPYTVKDFTLSSSLQLGNSGDVMDSSGDTVYSAQYSGAQAKAGIAVSFAP